MAERRFAVVKDGVCVNTIVLDPDGEGRAKWVPPDGVTLIDIESRPDVGIGRARAGGGWAVKPEPAPVEPQETALEKRLKAIEADIAALKAGRAGVGGK